MRDAIQRAGEAGYFSDLATAYCRAPSNSAEEVAAFENVVTRIVGLTGASPSVEDVWVAIYPIAYPDGSADPTEDFCARFARAFA